MKFKFSVKYLSKNEFEKVALVSYPRSGNTLLRKYVEDITRVATGSDGSLKRKLVRDLKERGNKIFVLTLFLGMAGEGIVNRRVWIVKSHYPERPEEIEFKAHKIILLVRNPMDAILSFFHMNATATHNCSISDDDFKKHEEIFEKFYEREIKIWTKFHKFWLNVKADIPIYIIKYEDLLEGKTAD